MDTNIRRRLRKCLEELVKRDRDLLDNDVNERSITHKLAEHIQREFRHWHVDCEYNRKGHVPKTLEGKYLARICPDDTYARTVYPDIIIHHRGTPDNLVAIEVKKRTNPDGLDIDRDKLAGYREEHRYKNTILVVLDGAKYTLEEH
jgi:hypothetical protein